MLCGVGEFFPLKLNVNVWEEWLQMNNLIIFWFAGGKEYYWSCVSLMETKSEDSFEKKDETYVKIMIPFPQKEWPEVALLR